MDNASDFSAENSPIADLIRSLGVPYVAGEKITDHYLNQAIGTCCSEDYGRVRLSKEVRKLIAANAPVDKPWMNCIPQQRRGRFLADLASITRRALPPKEPNSAELTSPPHVPT